MTFALVGVMFCRSDSVWADGYSLTMAPMKQNIVINPGDSYETSFRISNAAASTQKTYYKIEVEPFYVNEKNEIQFTADGDSGEIVKWIKFDVPTEGELSPNETKEVVFTVDVPKNASAGGQYLSILVSASGSPDTDDKGAKSDSMTIQEIKKMSHLVYAEVTGNVIRTGEIVDSNLPSFLLSGNITGSATVKNTGNTHQDASYTLQVYPLFSNEEVYTNEEEPATFTVLPGRELLSEITWDKTPEVGIFNVVFKGEFGGEKLEITKMIIKCPLWLLFVILFVIFSIVIFFVIKFKKRHSDKAEA
jgi:hypothetical protein